MVDALLRAAPHRARSERERQQADEVYAGQPLRVCALSLTLHDRIELFLRFLSHEKPRQGRISIRVPILLGHALTAMIIQPGTGAHNLFRTPLLT